MTPTLGADLLSVVARINRLATQRVRMPLGFAQARLLSTIEDQGAARISDLAALHSAGPGSPRRAPSTIARSRR